MKITVITIVLNAPDELQLTINSVKEQDYNDIEYIVIDGDSMQPTKDIINKNLSLFDYTLSEKDKGCYDAMNKSLNIASGDFIIFMNAGDTFFSKSSVSDVVKKIKNNDSIYYGGAEFQDNEGNFIDNYDFVCDKYLITIQNICHQSIFYPKCFYKKNRYKTRYKLYADWNYNIRAYKNHKFEYLNTIVCKFKTGGLSSKSTDHNFYKDRGSMILSNLGLSVYIKYIKRQFKNWKNGISEIINKQVD